MGFSSMYDDARDWLTKPFTKDISFASLFLILVLFIIAAFIAYDAIRILKQWMDAAADAVIEATT